MASSGGDRASAAAADEGGAMESTLTHRDRFGLLAAVAEVADGRLTLEETAARVCELVVPEYADMCVLDVVGEGGLRRLAVKLAGPEVMTLEPRVRNRPLPTGGEPGVGAAVDQGAPQLLTAFPDEVLRAMAKGEDDLALLRSLRLSAGIVIPLRARGRILGALTLLMTGHSGRAYTAGDLEFFEVFAGRVALALDNAGLFVELQTMEAQLSAALGSLTEAVTIQNPQGELIYANQAAAEMMGSGTPAEVVAQAGAELVGRYDFYHEDGTALAPGEFPGRQLLAGAEPGPLVMRVVDRQTGEQRWRMTTASAVHDSAGGLQMVVNVIADLTAVKRAEFAQRLLARAGEVFNSSLELQDTLQQVAELCVPDLADWCTVRLADEERQYLESVAVAHADPERVALVLDTREHYAVALDDPGELAEVFRTGKARCVNGITDEMLAATAKDARHLQVMRNLAPYGTLLLPMTAQAGTVGVLTLVTAESRRNFDNEDVELACELARRAATAVENARLYTERSRIAGTLQDSLLPDELPALPGWRTASLYRPAGQEDRVGGDFYEAIPLAKDTWMLVVGDVTGRGAAAASLTAMMRHTLRAIAKFTGSATQALDHLNRELVARPRTSLCTAVCVVLRNLDAGETQADIITAGHPLPLLVRQGTAQYVGEFGPILGVSAEESFEPSTLPVQPGDVLVLYSDGALDTVGTEDRFGPERLQAAVAGAAGAADAVARIEQALAGFQVGAQHDDIALLAVERVSVPMTPRWGSNRQAVHQDDSHN
jgi:PAS domain S-box-containing protein